ncbi:hypothetical protein F5Y11DRAFT_331918 [Daldinia sp. FL1419]|nr:hypothetical protein F5Y11DRAFT_331918 [Daldinia sp. FL1419]
MPPRSHRDYWVLLCFGGVTRTAAVCKAWVFFSWQDFSDLIGLDFTFRYDFLLEFCKPLPYALEAPRPHSFLFFFLFFFFNRIISNHLYLGFVIASHICFT